MAYLTVEEAARDGLEAYRPPPRYVTYTHAPLRNFAPGASYVTMDNVVGMEGLFSSVSKAVSSVTSSISHAFKSVTGAVFSVTKAVGLQNFMQQIGPLAPFATALLIPFAPWAVATGAWSAAGVVGAASIKKGSLATGTEIVQEAAAAAPVYVAIAGTVLTFGAGGGVLGSAIASSVAPGASTTVATGIGSLSATVITKAAALGADAIAEKWGAKAVATTTAELSTKDLREQADFFFAQDDETQKELYSGLTQIEAQLFYNVLTNSEKVHLTQLLTTPVAATLPTAQSVVPAVQGQGTQAQTTQEKVATASVIPVGLAAGLVAGLVLLSKGR